MLSAGRCQIGLMLGALASKRLVVGIGGWIAAAAAGVRLWDCLAVMPGWCCSGMQLAAVDMSSTGGPTTWAKGTKGCSSTIEQQASCCESRNKYSNLGGA